LGGNRCNRNSTVVALAVGVAAEAPGSVHLGKIGLEEAGSAHRSSITSAFGFRSRPSWRSRVPAEGEQIVSEGLQDRNALMNQPVTPDSGDGLTQQEVQARLGEHPRRLGTHNESWRSYE
jgi:hypothetical protein